MTKGEKSLWMGHHKKGKKKKGKKKSKLKKKNLGEKSELFSKTRGKVIKRYKFIGKTLEIDQRCGKTK